MKKIYIIPEVEVIQSDLTDAVMLVLSTETEADTEMDVLGREDGLEDSWTFAIE
ncbi:MAG: hypothetical protein IJT19_10000 [Bacteroidaceae bacterium]|nr:hypothetical protein [Bacteroidaceae bacterium]